MSCRRTVVTFALTMAALLACGRRSLAGGGPENVAVVVNADSWASLAVANEYIALRRVPECNVVYLAGLPSNLSIDVNQFRDLVLKPVFQTLQQRGLAGQIDCIAYSADMPYSVHVQADVDSKKNHRVLTPEASINGLTYLYELVLAKNSAYLSLAVNAYHRGRRGVVPEKPPAAEQQERLAKASRLMHEKKWSEAEPELRGLAAALPKSSLVQYELACCLARLGKGDEAMAAFQRAVEAGWLDVRHAQRDEDLASVRGRPEFKKLLEKIEATQFDVEPPRAFHNSIAWSPSGQPAAGGPSMHYMLSTMLAVTSGRGNSVREAIECLRRSAAADGTCPPGTVYYVQNGDIRSTTRQWGFKSAAAKLKALGVRAEVIEGVLPKDKRDVAGAMIGIADFQWKPSGSTILPGAICEHLTSCGGIMHESGGQTPLSEFLRHGAAAASGTVTEPYAIQAKFPTAFLHVFYARGCTLAESFYQSLHGPYQLLIVGDPLCRPWARLPKVEIESPAAGSVVKDVLRIKPKAAAAAPKIGRYEVYVDGHRVAAAPPGGEIEVQTASLAEGYHEVRLAAVVGDEIETQSSTALPITVSRRGLSMEVVAPSKAVALGQPVVVQAKMREAKRIVWLQNGREIAAVAGPEGSASIPSARLGLGRVRLQPVAILSDAPGPTAPVLPGNVYLGKPIEVMIEPPKPLPAIKDRPQSLVPGLKLSADKQSAVVERVRDGDWLAKTANPGQEFVLEGYFDAPVEDMYQFQLRTPLSVELSVDSQTIQPSGDGKSPQHFPVALAAGTHLLRIKGRMAEKATMELYFGGPGAPTVAADRFRHKQ